MSESDPAGPIAAVEHLFRAIERTDIAAILDSYLHEDRLFVILEGPRSSYSGFDPAARRTSWSTLLGKTEFMRLGLLDDRHAGRCGDLGWVAGTIHNLYRERGSDGPGTVHETRGTWILERIGGDWKIVTEHVSLVSPDPYPTG